MFRTKFVDEIKTHILCSITPPPRAGTKILQAMR